MSGFRQQCRTYQVLKRPARIGLWESPHAHWQAGGACVVEDIDISLLVKFIPLWLLVAWNAESHASSLSAAHLKASHTAPDAVTHA